MTPNDTWVRDAVLARLSGRPLALLFGSDGALAPRVEHPARAELPEPVRARLLRLAHAPGLSVGVVGACEPDLCGEAGTGPVTTEERGDKGAAVRWILDRLSPPVFAIYFGASANDTPAVEAVHDAGGTSVAVGPAAPALARYRVESPETVHADLATFCAALDLIRGRLDPFDREEPAPVVRLPELECSP
jgi:hypothetical protein